MKIGSRVMHILNRGNMFIVSFLALFRGPTYSIHVLLLYDRLSIFVVNPQVYCCNAVGCKTGIHTTSNYVLYRYISIDIGGNEARPQHLQ